MSKPLCTIALIALSAPLVLADAAPDDLFAESPWQIRADTDAMTDETAYFIISSGSHISTGYSSYRPELVIRLKPKGVTTSGGVNCQPEIMIDLGDHVGVDRTGCDLALRFDKRKPITETWIPSTSRKAIFSPDNALMLKRLKASTNLIARYTTTLGQTHTTTFNVAGLTNALHTVKTRYLEKRKP